MTTTNVAAMSKRVLRQGNAEEHRQHEHDDDLGERADAGRERLAEDQRGARRRRHEQLVEDARVALPDDLDPVEDRDEETGLRDDSRREEVEVRVAPGRDRMDPVEGLAEDDEPQDGLNGAGEELGPVVAELLQLDEAERQRCGSGRCARAVVPAAAQPTRPAVRRVRRISRSPPSRSPHRRACSRCGAGTRPRASPPSRGSGVSSSGRPTTRSVPRCIIATRSHSASASSM